MGTAALCIHGKYFSISPKLHTPCEQKYIQRWPLMAHASRTCVSDNHGLIVPIDALVLRHAVSAQHVSVQWPAFSTYIPRFQSPYLFQGEAVFEAIFFPLLHPLFPRTWLAAIPEKRNFIGKFIRPPFAFYSRSFLSVVGIPFINIASLGMEREWSRYCLCVCTFFDGIMRQLCSFFRFLFAWDVADSEHNVPCSFPSSEAYHWRESSLIKLFFYHVGFAYKIYEFVLAGKKFKALSRSVNRFWVNFIFLMLWGVEWQYTRHAFCWRTLKRFLKLFVLCEGWFHLFDLICSIYVTLF